MNTLQGYNGPEDFIALNAKINDIASAGRNVAYTNGSTTIPTTPTAGVAFLFLAAIVLPVRASGLFDVAFSLAGTGASAGATTINVQLTTQTQAAAFAFTNNLQAVGSVAPVGGAVNFSTAGAGVLVTGGPFGSLVQWDSGVQAVGTTTVAETVFSANLRGVQNSITGNAAAPFTGNVCFLLSMKLSAGVFTIPVGGLTFSAQERY